jgi:hypothetical protein
MSIQTLSNAPSNASDASFRLWGKAISDALTALGITKTADTGQIDWTTVTKPASANAYAGYEIRQFTDALQSSNPVIFKIQYGCGGTVTFPALLITIGHASDGAGALTGEVTTDLLIASGNTSTTAYTSWITGDTGWFSMGLWSGGGSNLTHVFCLERLKDTAGADTDAGVQAIYMAGPSSGGKQSQSMLPKTGAVYGPYFIQSAMPGSGSGGYGANVGVFPVFPNLGYAGNPCLGCLLYFTADIPRGTAISVPMYGTNHTYIAVGDLGPSTTSLNGNSTSHSLMIRYE